MKHVEPKTVAPKPSVTHVEPKIIALAPKPIAKHVEPKTIAPKFEPKTVEKPKLLVTRIQPKLPTITATKAVTTASTLVTVTRGQRLPNLGAFVIAYNSQLVNFDVQPRVENGVPLTPFRHLIEKAGGSVDWEEAGQNVKAQADGRKIALHIGDNFALINSQTIGLERASFVERGRTIVPLSFMRDALNVNIEYDKKTGHVLITSTKK